MENLPNIEALKKLDPLVIDAQFIKQIGWKVFNNEIEQLDSKLSKKLENSLSSIVENAEKLKEFISAIMIEAT